MQANRENYKARDYVAMVKVFYEIESIQLWRYDQLTQLNGLLQEMDTILASAGTAATA